MPGIILHQSEDKNKAQGTSRVLEIRKRRRRRRLKIFSTVIFVASLIAAYMLGALNVPMELAQNFYSDIIISMEPGEGFPVYADMQNFSNAAELGGGVAVLLNDELKIYSAKGNVLSTLPHGYINPVMNTGEDNICLYTVGGTNITVESRAEHIATKDFETPILIAELNGKDNIAVATKSKLEVFDDNFNSIWQWQTHNIVPLALEFSTNNKDFALATLNSENGFANCDIMFFNLNSGEINAEIKAEGVPLKMLYKSGELTVVFDTYAAVYNAKTGEEIYRYTYNYPSILSCHIDENANTAILIGNINYPGLTYFVVLNDKMEVVTENKLPASAESIKLADGNVYIMHDDYIEKYGLDNNYLGQLNTVDKPYAVVSANELLYITQKAILPLDINVPLVQ